MNNRANSCHSIIYYAVLEAGKSEKHYQEYMRIFPAAMLKKLTGYKNEVDRIRYIMGRVLLLRGAAALGFGNFDLGVIQFNGHNKPFLKNGFHFNLSHSGIYVFCVFNLNYRVGIDVEEIKHIDVNEFYSILSAAEKRTIEVSIDPMKQFYRIWTRKEAIVKADGRGLFVHLADVDVTNECLLLGETCWVLREIKLADNYVVHMATEQYNDLQPVIYRINI